MSDNKEPKIESIYVLYAAEDEKDVREWRVKEASKLGAPAVFTTELPLARLSERHAVIGLSRPSAIGKEQLPIRASKPIRVAQHWKGASEHVDGQVITSAFVQALSTETLPAVGKLIRNKPDEVGTLKLGYA